MSEDDPSAAKRKRAREQIDAADWEALRLRLAKFAERQLRWRFPLGALGGKVGMNYVHDAIWKLLEGVHAVNPAKWTEGQRQWDPDTHSLYGTLCFGITSDIDNDAKQWRRQQRLLEKDCATAGTILPSAPTLPDDAVQYAEERNDCLNAFKRPLSRDIARIIIDEGIYDAGEQAIRLGVDLKTIYNERKRMKEFLTSDSVGEVNGKE